MFYCWISWQIEVLLKQIVFGDLWRAEKSRKSPNTFWKRRWGPNSPENEETSLIRPPSEFRNSLEVFLTKKSRSDRTQTHNPDFGGKWTFWKHQFRLIRLSIQALFEEHGRDEESTWIHRRPPLEERGAKVENVCFTYVKLMFLRSRGAPERSRAFPKKQVFCVFRFLNFRAPKFIVFSWAIPKSSRPDDSDPRLQITSFLMSHIHWLQSELGSAMQEVRETLQIVCE